MRLFGVLNLYGLVIGLGVFAALGVVNNLANKEAFRKDLVWDALPWVLIPGIIGARAYHVIDLWSYYSQYPTLIVQIWQGGLGIFGGLIGGLLGLLMFWRYDKGSIKDLIKIIDVSAIGIPLAQAIGRWGNYFNQELYGGPTNVPWAIFIDTQNRLAGFENYDRFHPLFLYESLLNILLFGLLYFLYLKQCKVGQGRFLGLYLLGYGSIRFMLEPFRLERWELGGIPTAQIVSGVLIVFGLTLLLNSKHRVSK